MTVKTLLTGNEAAAWAARLADVDYIPGYPITPQTEIIETLAHWIRNGELKAKFVTMDSEHSMVTAAGAASATGARVFTTSSSQGFLYSYEMLFNLSGWRVPVVMANVSRALSAPITLEPDHNDVLSARDTGFIQIHCETVQEILDSILMAFRVSEDERILLPSIVNFDGFYLSFTREIVEIPEEKEVREFLPAYVPKHAFISSKQPMVQGAAVLNASLYSYFRYQLHLAAENALGVYREVAQEFRRKFGRDLSPIEKFMMDDAEYAIVMMGSFTTKGKKAVTLIREKGTKVGLTKLRLLRPFPTQDLVEALSGLRGIAVIDQNISPGKGGVLFSELSSALYNLNERPMALSFIGGLGGKDISQAEFEFALSKTISAEEGKEPIPRAPILLFTQSDDDAVRRMLKLGHGEAE